MTVAKAKLFKTAVVCTGYESVFPNGTFVAVRYLSGTKTKMFECSACGLTEVLNEYQLHSFVL